jgi:RNA polymerase sigma factor (sigma-70 family)
MIFSSEKFGSVTAKDIESAKVGNSAAQKLIYETYSPMVYGIAKRIFRETGYAEDVLQDTFIDVFTKLDTFRGDASLGAWIRRIATNRCLMLLRSSWVSKSIDVDIDTRSTSSHEDEIILQEELELAIATLSIQARAVLLLHDVEGYKHREIAKTLGKTESYSKSQLARAHIKLKLFLEKTYETKEERWIVR